MKKLQRSFYYQNGIELAKNLLGKVLVHKTEPGTIRGIITETEAYMGISDKASHAYQGLRSKRTETMYHKGGTAYVYLIYGMYSCMNVVANRSEIPEAVLIRGVLPYDKASERIMQQLHPVKQERSLSNGPGKLCLAMKIDCSMDDRDLCAPRSDFYIADAGIKISEDQIVSGPRINIDYAEEAKDYPWRFYIPSCPMPSASDETVSGRIIS